MILSLRLIFKLIGAGSSNFILLLYGISSPFYEPFRGMLPHVGQGRVEFELSTFIAIIIIVIIDVTSDIILNEIFKRSDINNEVVPNYNNLTYQNQILKDDKPHEVQSTLSQNQQYPQSNQPLGTVVNINYNDDVNKNLPQQFNGQNQSFQDKDNQINNRNIQNYNNSKLNP